MSIPYETAVSGEKALIEIQRTLSKFGCSTFGQATDAKRGVTMIQFRWRDKNVSLEASWKGYAVAWLKAAFMPHMLLPSGERVIDRVQSQILALPECSENAKGGKAQ